MKLNTKIRYGLRTMIELALSAGDTGILQKDIAERQDIPLKYLDKIISDLKSSGLIINVGGKRSGYILARSTVKISVYDIYKAFEGDLALIPCINESAHCCKHENCASQEFWTYLNTEMEAIMVGRNLKSLVDMQTEMNASVAKEVDYQI